MGIYFRGYRGSKRRCLVGMMACFLVLLLSTSHRWTTLLKSNMMLSQISNEKETHNLREVDRANATTGRPTPILVSPRMHTNTCVIPSKMESHSSYEANISSIAFDVLEQQLFESSHKEVLSLVKRTNVLLAEKLKNQSRNDEKNYTAEKQYFDRDLLKIGSYYYIPGGRWRPSDCNPKWKVAIVIPFRDRNVHLAMLIHNLIPFLKNQKLEFGFFVGEQYNNLDFNRGLMKNVGYLGATRFGDWDCVIFHDTDLIPMKGENYYGCDHFPRHFAAYTEQFKYRLPYEDIFGGVVGLTAEQVRQSNGYSNAYWGWGGEDDELLRRLQRKGYKVSREKEHGYYRSLQHKPKVKAQICPEVDCLYNNFKMRADWEGINNMTYSRDSLELFPLYTKISVDIQKEAWNSNMPPCQNFINHRHADHA